MIPRRRALGLLAAAALAPRAARAAAPRLAVVDWAVLETALALGIVPTAAAELRQFRIQVGPVPEAVADLGLRGALSFEALAAVAPEAILISDFYERQRPALERIATVRSLTVYREGEAPYAAAGRMTRELAALAGAAARGEAYAAAADAELAALRRPSDRPLFVVSLGDARHVRAFGTDSMFGEVLARLGRRNAWDRPTRYAAAAPVGVEALARVPEAAIAVVGPLPPDARRALAEGPIWQALPAVRAGRVAVLPPVNHYGGLPAALRFARLLAAAHV